MASPLNNRKKKKKDNDQDEEEGESTGGKKAKLDPDPVVVDAKQTPVAATGPRKPRFQPNDRILFVYLASRRVFEGVVTDVEIKYVWVTLLLPKRKEHGLEERRAIRLNTEKHMKQFELLSLFRPATVGSHAPPGHYLDSFPFPDLWLEVGDCIEIIKQGSIISHSSGDGYSPQHFVAQVTSVSDLTARLQPIPTASSSGGVDEKGGGKGGDSSSSGAPPVWDQSVLEGGTASGQVVECGVPRNTLRFQSFVRRPCLQIPSPYLQLSLIPSSIVGKKT